MPDIESKIDEIREEDAKASGAKIEEAIQTDAQESAAQFAEFGNIGHSLSFRDLMRLATRIFTVKPTRTFLTILGTSVGIATVVFLISLGYGLQNVLLGKLITSQDSLITLQAFYPSESNLAIDQNIIDNTTQLPTVGEISKVSEYSGEEKVSTLSGFIVARLVDVNYFRLSGLVPDIGMDFSNNDGVVVTNQALRLINMPVDKTSLNKDINLTLYPANAESATSTQEIKLVRPMKIIGIISDEAEAPMIIAPSDAFSEKPTSFKEMYVKGKTLDVVEGLKDKLTAQGFVISARLDLVQQAQKIMNIITIVLGVFGVAALTVSAIGMFNTMIVGFLERIYEVGVMKALGATDKDVRNLFLAESFIMGVLGGTTGVLIGMGAGKLFNMIFSMVANKLGGKSIDLFYTPVWFIVMIIVASALIGVGAGYWPARSAKSLSPKEAFLRK